MSELSPSDEASALEKRRRSAVEELDSRGLFAVLSTGDGRTWLRDPSLRSRFDRFFDLGGGPQLRVDGLDVRVAVDAALAQAFEHSGDDGGELRLTLHRGTGDDGVAYAVEQLTSQATASANSPGRLRLSLAHCRVTGNGLAHLAELSLDGSSAVPTLTHLDLGDTWVTSDALRHLVGFDKLRDLRLRSTDIDDSALAYLESLPSLEVLDLGHTEITGTERVKRVGEPRPDLIELRLEHTQVSNQGLREIVERWPGLRILHLEHTKVDDEGLGCLSCLPCLHTLHLDDVAGVTAAGLGRLNEPNGPKLKHLDLRRTSVGGAELALEAMTSLEVLSLRGTVVRDSALADLSALPHLAVLDLEGTLVTDSGLEHLKGLESLHVLDLQDTSVTDAGLEALTQLKLERLDLQATKVTDSWLRGLRGAQGGQDHADFAELRVLDLEDTRMSDRGIGAIVDSGVLPAMQVIDVTNTDVTERGRQRLREGRVGLATVPSDPH